MTDEPVEQVWERYSRTRERADRDLLILSYQPLVKFVAGKVAVGLPQNVEQADLVSYGIFGLIDAIERFDLDRGYKFETYAMARIKGAIVDELRGFDIAPRSIRAKARAHDEAHTKLEGRLHRPPTDQEIAADLGVSVEQYYENVSQIERLNVVSLETIVPTDRHNAIEALVGHSGFALGGLGLSLGGAIADPHRAGDGAGEYDVEELRANLIEVIQDMTHREQIVLHLYYRENLSLAEVGVVLGVTPSRASQIHTQAVRTIWSKITS